MSIVTIVWVLYGYSIAFSNFNMKAGEYNLNSFFGTLHHGGLSEISIFSSTGNYPASVFITFHLMFAAITTALITGAFAERMKVTAVWAFAIGRVQCQSICRLRFPMYDLFHVIILLLLIVVVFLMI